MTKAVTHITTFHRPMLSRVVPFGLFMAFIGLEEAIRFASHYHWANIPETATYYLYPIKAISVAAVLYFFRRDYDEIRARDLRSRKGSAAACALGLLTFVLWISMDWTLSVAGAPKGFNPHLLPAGPVGLAMTATRIAGAVLVVPIMEELFWRSFLLRYLIHADFETVDIGTFTWGSFLASTVLFGLEHHLFVAGMVAGAIYNILLYKTRSLAQCILAHAITNLALAIYVLYTGKWYFW